MTPLEDVAVTERRLHSRSYGRSSSRGLVVPVFRGERQRIVGLLFVKDLIFVDPEDETALTSLLGIFARVADRRRDDSWTMCADLQGRPWAFGIGAEAVTKKLSARRLAVEEGINSKWARRPRRARPPFSLG